MRSGSIDPAEIVGQMKCVRLPVKGLWNITGRRNHEYKTQGYDH